MKKLVSIIFAAFILCCEIVQAQNIATDQEAIAIFQTHPPKYAFEGVYEMYTDYKEDHNFPNSDYDREYEGFKSAGKKICIFFDGSNLKALVIGEKRIVKGTMENDGWLDAFKVDDFGVLTFNFVHRSIPELKLTYVPDNEYRSSSVRVEGSNLFFDEDYPMMFGVNDFGKEFGSQCHYKYYFKKVYSPLNYSSSENNVAVGSGTGFALTSTGYIVTNDHVVNGAKKITVKGINGNFQKQYDAKIVTVDKNNDLAVIQITDPEFKSLGKVPYIISNKTSDVGSSVFALGYPLRASMGDEIKLTNGIVSAKSGYQGDITTYQISVPLQPGNSGGPLFDSKGILIGVVNAKLTVAENASYAIKTSYLLSLIETLGTVPRLQTVNTLANKSLAEQAKAVKNFIYIIEVK